MEYSRRRLLKILGFGISGLCIFPELPEARAIIPQGLSDLLTDESGSPVRNVQDWLRKRASIKSDWSKYLGVIPADPVSPAIKVIQEESVGEVIRQFVEYENEPGAFVKAYLLKPKFVKDKMPGVVALHSTSDNQMRFIAGVEKGDIPPSGLNLAGMGFVVICPQCFLWRDKEGRSYEEQANRFMENHPGSKGMAGMLYDAMRAVDVLRVMPEVDSNRIGAMGHSLGGKETLYLAAFDDRVKVVVSNEGGIGIDFSNWDDAWYLGKEIHSFGHQHHEILALCAPRPFLLIGGSASDGEKSRAYIDAVKPVYRLYGKEKDLEFFNHGKGHDIVPESDKITFDWLIRHLGTK